MNEDLQYLETRYPGDWAETSPEASSAEAGSCEGIDSVAAVASLAGIVEKGVARVRERIPIEAAFLFGSQASGEANEDSDIDLAIFSPAIDGLNLFERVRLASELELGCDSSLELHLFSSRALANARPTNFAGYIVARGKRVI